MQQLVKTLVLCKISVFRNRGTFFAQKNAVPLDRRGLQRFILLSTFRVHYILYKEGIFQTREFSCSQNTDLNF